MLRPSLAIVWAILMATIAGCGLLVDDSFRAGRSLAPGEQVLTIDAGTQAHVNGVAIGVSNIREEAYTNNFGEQLTGLTASLSFAITEPRPATTTTRVYPGLVLGVQALQIEVADIRPAGVLLIIEKAE